MTQAAIPDVELSEQALLAEASRATGGLSDFGDDSFREPLRVLLESLNGEARLNKAGRFGRFQRMTQLLMQRLLLEDLVKRHPDILEEQIRQPIFILGLQRTGSTKLQKILATDPKWHTPLLWEALSPAPLPGEPVGDPSMRIAIAQQFADMIYTVAPEAWPGHPMIPCEVEEETFAVEMSFRWTVPATFANVPTYIKWVEAHTVVPTYRYLKLILQVLQWQKGAERPWILKSPWHIGFLAAILEVFPDASIVQTHRDPLVAIASSCALMYAGLRLSTDDPDKKEHGANVLTMMSREMNRHLAQRDAIRDPTLDVQFERIRDDAVAVARQICAARNWELDAAAAARIRRWEADNPQHKHGRFVYSPEEFGLTRENVTNALRDYCRRFGFA